MEGSTGSRPICGVLKGCCTKENERREMMAGASGAELPNAFATTTPHDPAGILGFFLFHQTMDLNSQVVVTWDTLELFIKTNSFNDCTHLERYCSERGPSFKNLGMIYNIDFKAWTWTLNVWHVRFHPRLSLAPKSKVTRENYFKFDVLPKYRQHKESKKIEGIIASNWQN